MPIDLAGIIDEGFYCNRRYAAATSLTAGGLAARSVNILFQACFPPSRLRVRVSLAVSAVSSRTRVNMRANRMLKNSVSATGRVDAQSAFGQVISRYQAKYPKAAEKLEKDSDSLFAFYNFPAEHWMHLRMTNPEQQKLAA